MSEERTVSPSKVDGLIERVIELYRWIDDRFKATAAAGIRISFPTRFSYILSNLGMATVVCFLVTIATGIPLLMYYRPTPWSAAFDSIKYITDEVAFGALLRGVHYHASNGMVLLAILHVMYVFFKRLYKGRFDFLWVTGVILGVVTVLTAFTGYTLIFNDRAVEAQDIMLGITKSVNPLLGSLLAGTGLSDRALRIYAFHIGALPALIIALLSVHMPRALRISIPTIIGIFASLFIATALYPAELGPKFDPAVAPEFMPPEWYFLSIYTLLRTWAPVFYVGVLLPGILILITALAPWLDTGRRPKMTDRPKTTILGITSIVFWIYLTIRGTTGVGPPATQVPPYEIVGVFVAILAASTAVFRLMTPFLLSRTRTTRRPKHEYLGGHDGMVLLLLIVGVQALLFWSFASAYIMGNNRLTSLNIGLILFGLGLSQHIYAIAAKGPPKV